MLAVKGEKDAGVKKKLYRTKSKEAVVESAVEEKMKAVEKVKDDLKVVVDKGKKTDLPGVDEPFPLKEFGYDLEHWANNVQYVLMEDHRAEVENIRLKTMGKTPGCMKCRNTGCRHCSWSFAVRYWRRVETNGKFQYLEGYDRLVKQPTVEVIE